MKRFLMPLIAILFINGVKAQSACDGLHDPMNFMGWYGKTGIRATGVSTSTNIYNTSSTSTTTIQWNSLASVVTTGSCGSGCNVGSAPDNNKTRFQIITTPGNDSYTNGGMTRIPLGATRAIRLGDMCSASGESAEALFYEMQVTAQNALIFIDYAVVLESPQHGATGNPEFIIRVCRKVNGQWQNAPINDSLYYIIQAADQNAPLPEGWFRWNGSGSCKYTYKPWAKVAINLYQYLYSDVRIEIYLSDCNAQFHGGYCYISGECQPMQLTGGGCAAGASTEVTKLHAPKGLRSYQWQRRNLAGAWEDITVGGNDSILSVQSTDFPVDPTTRLQASENEFKCIMTSCLDPAKPITSYLQTTVKNKKPYIAIDDSSMCDGTVIVTDRSQCFSVDDPSDAVDTSLSVWDFGDGSPLQYGGTASHRYSELGNYNVTLTTYAANQTCYAEGSRTVKARRRPPLNITTEDTAICRGERLRFMSGTDVQLENYRWVVTEVESGRSDTIYNDQELMYTFRDTSIVELRAMNMEGCDTIVQKMIYVEDIPTLSVNGDSIVCNGTEAVVNVGADIANCTFGWYLDTTLTSPSYTGSQLRRTPTQDETYYVKVTTPNGCQSWGSFGIHLMVPEMSSNKTKMCADETVVLKGEGAVYYEWTANPPDPSLEGQQDSSQIEVSPDVTTTYTMVGLGQNGCRATPLTKKVTVYPFPIPEIDYSPNFVDSEDPFVTFEDISEGSTWTEWDFHDGNKSNKRSIIYEFKDLTADSVYITMRTANDLGCESDTTIALSVSVFSVWLPNAFTPDKSSNNIFRSYTGNDIRDYSLYIYDRAGNQVFFTNDREGGWDGTYEGKKCKQGVYVWVVNYRRIETDKVIQQKGTLTLLR